MSQLVTMMTQDEDAAKGDVPLTDVKSAVLAKVIEFCSHHVEQRLPEIEKVRPAAGPGGSRAAEGPRSGRQDSPFAGNPRSAARSASR
jgi:hypothetical protein